MENKRSFRVTFGYIPGYREENSDIPSQFLPVKVTASKMVAIDPLQTVAKAWDQAATEVEKAYGYYVSAVFNSSLTVYPTKFGCPSGGEPTVTAAGSLNPHFVPKDQQQLWQHAVRRTVETCKELLKQTTVTLEWFEAEIEYFSDRLREGPAG